MTQVKDSGKRVQLGGGMVRDTEEGKTDYSLVFDGPMLDRWAEHMTAGADKYEPRNWMLVLSASREEIEAARDRAIRSFLRHARQWLRGDSDEDHAAAAFFNINMAEAYKAELVNRAELERSVDATKPKFRYFREDTTLWKMPVTGEPGWYIASDGVCRPSEANVSHFNVQVEATEAAWKAAGGT